MKPFLSLMLATGVGCVIAFLAAGGRAQEQEKPASIFSSFNSVLAWKIQGACVVETTDKITVTLDNPTVRAIGERVFLVGAQVDTGEKLKRDFTKIQFGEDATLWIPVDSIKLIGQIPMDQ